MFSCKLMKGIMALALSAMILTACGTDEPKRPETSDPAVKPTPENPTPDPTPDPTPEPDPIGESAMDAARAITAGWNLGNSLEVPEGETAWGNPRTSKILIEKVHAAGFNALRLPCAWGSHLVSDAQPYTIDPAWLHRVQEVVDYAYSLGMYVIINTHWDGGWLELHGSEAHMEAVAAKERAIWTQIATHFAPYGQRLIFAGNNEMRSLRSGNEWWGEPDAGERRALNLYNKTFVEAVRATGGNNAVRNLVVQAWCCNPWYALGSLEMPADAEPGHLMAEVHFYDPMDYTHSATGRQLWGVRPGYVASDTNGEDYIDNLFGQLKARFVDSGYPVVLGEYGTVSHSASNARIKEAEAYYLEYVTMAARKNGIVPFVWDNGQPGTGSFGLFDRRTGIVKQQHMVDGILSGAAKTNYPF